MSSLYSTLNRAFHCPETRLYNWVQGVIWTLIVASVVLFTAELANESPLGELGVMGTIDTAILWIFGLELFLRVASFHPPIVDFYRLSPAERTRAHLLGRLKFLTSPLMLIDVLTVLALVPEFRGLRAMRLMRLLRNAKLFRHSNLFASIGRAFADNQLVYTMALSLLGIEVLLGGLTVFLAEARVNPDVTQLSDGFWWAAVTLTTVGFGDITPITPLGRLVGVVLMVGGMFTLALFAAIVGHTMLGAVVRLREEQIRMSDRMDHVIVCGYDRGAEMLLDSLQTEYPHHKELLLFNLGERPTELPPRFVWVQGDPTKESELGKAKVETADTIIVVGSREVSPQSADATTILTVFTLRSYLAKSELIGRRVKTPYVIAEVLDAENANHARAAGADEVLESTRIAFSMIAHSSVEPGTGAIMAAVATHDAHSLHVCTPKQLPEDVRTYGAASNYLGNQHAVLAIGIRRDHGKDLLNPSGETPLKDADKVIYLAERPISAEGNVA